MKFLLNENIPPSLVGYLRSEGYDSIHSINAGLSGKKDEEVIHYASANDYIIITHDLDYGRIISLSGEAKPSVITFRQKSISPEIITESLMITLPQIKEILQMGALVSIDQQLIRYRLLPFKRD